MYKAITSQGKSALTNLKMKAVTSHYDSVVKGTQLESVLEKSRLLMPDEHLNLTDELTLVREVAADALKDYVFAKSLPDSPQSRQMLSCAGAILVDKLKDVKELCVTASQLEMNKRGINLSTIAYGDLIAFVMGAVNNNTATTIDAEKIEQELRNNISFFETEEINISKPSDDKLVSEMDYSIPKE